MDSDLDRSQRWTQAVQAHPRRILALAIALSLALHLIATQWKVWLPGEIAPLQPLAVAITELPPPPSPAPAPSKPKPKPKRHVSAPAVPADVPAMQAEPVAAAEPAIDPVTPTAPADSAPAAEAPAEPAIVATEPKLSPPLPARVDLVYRAFLGTRGFQIGEAVYRFEHEANQYSITTVAEARGIAALFFRGQGKLASRGTITADGLQPNSYSVERTSDNRREATTFDWESGLVLLNGDKTEPIEVPTSDPLTMLWHFYFAPPGQEDAEFNIATTRKVYHYRFHRTGTETVTLPFGDVETEIWRRESGDGSLDAQIWLAPSLHYVAVKLRLSNERGTLEALLDQIRADAFVAQQ